MFYTAYLVKKLTCGDGTVLNHLGKTISSGNSSNNASLNCTNDNSCRIVGGYGANDLLSGLDVIGVDRKVNQSYQDVLQPVCYSPPVQMVQLPPLPSTAATDPSGGTPIDNGISGGYILLFLVVVIFSGLIYKSRSAKPPVMQYLQMQQPVQKM